VVVKILVLRLFFPARKAGDEPRRVVGRELSFREEKIQKEEIFREGPITEGHLSERSFLDLRGHFSILIQMR